MSSVTIKTTPLNLIQQLAAFRQFKDAFPRYVGNIAVNFYKDSFRRQGFINQGGLERWPGRKGKGKNKLKRAILVKSGRLRRSPRIIRTGLGYVVVGSDVPYARIHNEGGRIQATQKVGSFKRKAYTRTWNNKKQKVSAATVKSHSRKINTVIPKRQFMGQSAFLNRRILMTTDYKLKQILNR